ncbi:MAG: 50S ribosomal protein L21 [Clostridia bacterium]|nr:50S ribosomal protein L21 [Clostridia bacterium]
MFAIIETGGKQYKVSEGDMIRVELLTVEEGSTIEIDKVLAVFDGKQFKAGAPYIKGAKVACKVLEHGKGKKIVVFHYKPNKNIRTKNGHRQPYTKLQVETITKSAPRAPRKPKEEAQLETVEA